MWQDVSAMVYSFQKMAYNFDDSGDHDRGGNCMNDSIITELVNGLRLIYNDRLVSVILYGSVAKGTNSEESDIDIAIILKDANEQPNWEKLIDFTVDLDLKYDKVFSVISIDYDEFTKWEGILPFYKNVKKDGVILWKTA